MEKYEYQVVMARIKEIEQKQLSTLEYVCRYLDHKIDVQKENVSDRMLQLWEEKNKLYEYVK